MNNTQNKKPNEEYTTYNTLGKNYHWKWLKNRGLSYYEYIQTILNDILKLIDKTNSKIILDAGCGDGVLLYLLYKNKKYLKLYGFDFIESAIQYAKKKLKKKAEVFVFDLRDLDELDKAFDFIICTETIDHVLPPEPLSTSEKLRTFHVNILNELIGMANKGAYFTIPAKEEWRSFEQDDKDSSEPILEEWLESLNLNSNWRYLTTDKNNPKGTYIVEIIK
ncbi:MAG: class I SAM-dependent methyltransferase [Candidatus Thorarchaeota archaeon]